VIWLKKGDHGGNMVSHVAKRPDWVGIPVAGIERLMEHAAQAL
jgi:predicted trehalose synthase